MKTGLLLSLLCAAAIAGGALPARACDFDPRDAQNHIDNAGFIFTGTVTGFRHLENKSHMSGATEYEATFSIDKVFKGDAGTDTTANVAQLHDRWSNYVYFDVGKKYLVLAAGDRPLDLKINGCSPVMSLDPASAASYEPGADYKYTLESQLGDITMFPIPKATGDGARKRLEQENQDGSGNQGGGGN